MDKADLVRQFLIIEDLRKRQAELSPKEMEILLLKLLVEKDTRQEHRYGQP